MSKAETATESLESILASIRKSLSEQSTDVLAEEPAALADAQGEAEVATPGDDGGLAQPASAAATEEAKARAAEAPAEASAPRAKEPPAPATGTSNPSTSNGTKDPLWFLGQPGDTAGKAGGQTAGANASASTPGGKLQAAESKLLRVGVVRGPLPPFFGSSAETAGLNGELNGKASAIFGNAGVDARPPAPDGTALPGLEAMVADLLRPMLRRWLDENMPRLVSAALKAEAELMSKRDSGRDPKKS